MYITFTIGEKSSAKTSEVRMVCVYMFMSKAKQVETQQELAAKPEALRPILGTLMVEEKN